MISAPLIKERFIDKWKAQQGGANIGLVFGVPETANELEGDDPLFKQAIGFNDPFGEFRVEEFCGPDTVEFDEDYTIPMTIQVIARSRDAGFWEVETRLADLLFQATRILQDPELALVDERISRLQISLGETGQISGWVSVGNTKLAAARSDIEILCEAHIKGALHP